VSFNYDLVIERVAPRLTLFEAGLGDEHDRRRVVDAAAMQGRQIIKPHGSLSLVYPDADSNLDRRLPLQSDPWQAINANRRFAIAGPGPGKLADSEGLFKANWELACKVISEAVAIVIIGYRLPETDAHAIEMLSQAIANNTRDAVVRIVLGPRRDEHVERLHRICEWSGRPITRIKHEPLWAQDFLAIFQHDKLWRPGGSPL
jgi:hypothetical protein